MEKFPEPSLLKIEFNENLPEEVKKRISFNHAKIKRISSKENYRFFFRFNFLTSFEYLNKKEVLENEIYIFNAKPIEGDLSQYIVLEGNPKEILVPDFSNLYFAAKEELKKRVQERRNFLSRVLSQNLEKQKERIFSEFKKETKAFQERIDGITEKMMDFAKKGDVESVSKEKRFLDSIKKDSLFEELEKDRDRAIQLEDQKHFLNIENRLRDVAAIYYPAYFVSISLEGEKGHLSKLLTLEFDPLTKEISGLKCESCSNKIKEVFLDEKGHAVCKNCITFCESCSKIYCKKDNLNSCEICSKRICRECSVRCSRCSKLICKSHAIKDKSTGKTFCPACLKRCERCEELKDPFSFRISPRTGAQICEDCFREENAKKVLEGVFR